MSARTYYVTLTPAGLAALDPSHLGRAAYTQREVDGLAQTAARLGREEASHRRDLARRLTVSDARHAGICSLCGAEGKLGGTAYFSDPDRPPGQRAVLYALCPACAVPIKALIDKVTSDGEPYSHVMMLVGRLPDTMP